MIPPRSWRLDRKGAVAVITALVMLVMLGLVGLAIDMGTLYQVNSTMSLAANSAAMNALKIASTAEQAGDVKYIGEGTTAGQLWFAAAVGTYASQVVPNTQSIGISLAGSTTITAKVTYKGSINSIFGNLFNVLSYPVNVEADASISTTPYLEILFLLDNSSSMDIGATNADIAKLSSLSPCDPSNAFYNTTNATTWANASANAYSDYSCSNGGQYDGVTPCPVAAGAPLAFAAFTPAANQTAQIAAGQTCQGRLPQQSNGKYPLPGPPCAFACHWTNNASADPLGGSNDLFGMARRNGVTLRFDLLKNATNSVLQQMQSDNLSFNNLSVGIYTFNTQVSQIYPQKGCVLQTPACEAGSDFTSARSQVGAPPVLPSIVDTGIPPVVGLLNLGPTNDDTAFPEAMNTLATTYVTPAGDGTTPTSRRKVLFLVTDGFEDDPNTGARRAFEPSYCTRFKDLGYTVFVVYTPYYPVMHVAYLSNWIPIVEGSGTASLSYNLQACSSGAGDYVSATDQTTLNSALLTFLKKAQTSVITFTK